GILNSVFSHYGDFRNEKFADRNNGVLISNTNGKVLAFALFNLQERGRLFLPPNVDVYEGQIVGIHARDNDLVVNPTRGKAHSNVRASGTDESIILTPHLQFSLEQCIDFIADDELVEVTPNHLRLRKKLLTESERKRAGRAQAFRLGPPGPRRPDPPSPSCSISPYTNQKSPPTPATSFVERPTLVPPSILSSPLVFP